MLLGAQPDVADWDLEVDNTTVIKKPVNTGSPVKLATVLEAKLPNEFTDYMTGAVLKTTDIDDIPSYIPEYDHQNGHQYTTNSESISKTCERRAFNLTEAHSCKSTHKLLLNLFDHKQLLTDSSSSHPNEKLHDNVSQLLIHDKANEKATDHSQDHQSCEQVICTHHYQRCGELEATWGKDADQDVSFHDNNTCEFHFDKVHEKQVNEAISDTTNEDKICAHHYQRCGELEATWGKGADYDSPRGDIHTSDDKKYEEMLPAAPLVPSEQSTAAHFHHHQPSDEAEATFSKPEPLIRSSVEETIQEASSSQGTAVVTTNSSPVISKQEKLDKGE
ncbi:hypothetical protein MN116_008824 [Schistosoma mekongi]|uniref:Uncharacterized protein n=1 Tax=Schistosoma mekongi TaxID=38744 RepID=A0AAE2D160_SCHME|nr:hypothetical protein MN116_008824 [Schistosoma mekongi]